MSSQDGRGRTLFEILTGRNKKDMRPLELQYHNPLEARVGSHITLDQKTEYKDVNFCVESIVVYKTEIGSKDFYHTDYNLKASILECESPIKLILRLHSDTESEIGYRVQLYSLFKESQYNEDFHNNELKNDSGELEIKEDGDGNVYDNPPIYWRVEGLIDPYLAKSTTLKDTDGDGFVEDNELEKNNVVYWDYSRMTDDSDGNEFQEYLTVEMDDDTGYFKFLIGEDMLSSQIFVI